MEPTVFVHRYWAKTWIWETQIRVYPRDGAWMAHSTMATSVRAVPYAWSAGDFDPADRTFEGAPPSLYATNMYGSPQTLRIVYVNEACVCPFCGHVTLKRRDNDVRDWWTMLLLHWSSDYCGGKELDLVGLATAEAAAKLHGGIPAFKFKLCRNCRASRRTVIDESPLAPAYGRLHDAMSPYRKLAAHILDDKERAAFWRTKQACHGIADKPICLPDAKRAILRRMRRKQLSPEEHAALAMLLGVRSLKKLSAQAAK